MLLKKKFTYKGHKKISTTDLLNYCDFVAFSPKLLNFGEELCFRNYEKSRALLELKTLFALYVSIM